MPKNLGDEYMLVELNLKCPSGSVKCEQVMSEAEATHNITEAGRVKATIEVFNTEYLKAVRREHTRVRNAFNAATLPWAEQGQRLIPNNKVKEIKAMVEDLKILSSSLWKDFEDNIESHKSRDKQVLGTLYNEANYPSKLELKEKHYVDIVFATVPDPEHDVRAGWDKETVEDYQSDTIEKERRRSGKAMKSLASRCHEYVERVADRCEKYTGDKLGSFKDTLIENVKDMIEMCKLFNINDDPEIQDWIDKMTVDIATVTPDQLREDD